MKLLLALTLLLFTPLTANATPVVGETAPDFTAIDSISGNEIKLSGMTGKIVVMEWTNNGCPFVRKHYDSNNMQTLQKETAGDDLVWISVASSAEGKQGYLTSEESNALIKKEGASPTYKILDPSGELGGLYDAKTTPHMFVVDTEGVLRYAGAIDSDSSPRESSIEEATNYVRSAVTSLRKGEKVEVSSTQPYGCSVKYK